MGGRPAALAGAYSALAADVYAPVWNPAGLGFVPAVQLSGLHAAQSGDGSYEFAGLAAPAGAAGGAGFSAQYFHESDQAGRDAAGTPDGAFSSHFGAYSAAYGRAFGRAFSVGAAIKLIDAGLGDASARAVAGDVGAMYRAGAGLDLAAVAANVGTKLKFLQESDPLPRQFRVAAAYRPAASVTLAAEGSFQREESAEGRFGAEWSPAPAFALRAGYRTGQGPQFSGASGVTAGAGLDLWGQKFDYAWLPMGALGTTQYFSATLSFGKRGGS